MKRNKIKEILKNNKKKIVTGTVVVAAVAGISVGIVTYNNHNTQNAKVTTLQSTTANTKEDEGGTASVASTTSNGNTETIKKTDGTVETKTTDTKGNVKIETKDSKGNIQLIKKDKNGKVVETIKKDKTGKVIQDIKPSTTSNNSTASNPKPSNPTPSSSKPSNPKRSNPKRSNPKRSNPTPSSSKPSKPKPSVTVATSVPFAASGLPLVHNEVANNNSITVSGSCIELFNSSLRYLTEDIPGHAHEVGSYWRGKYVQCADGIYKVTNCEVTGTQEDNSSNDLTQTAGYKSILN